MISITASGQSDEHYISHGMHKVTVEYANGASATLTPQIRTKNKRIPYRIAEATTVTTDQVYDVTGPGYLSFNVSGLSGTIQVFIDHVRAG